MSSQEIPLHSLMVHKPSGQIEFLSEDDVDCLLFLLDKVGSRQPIHSYRDQADAQRIKAKLVKALKAT